MRIEIDSFESIEVRGRMPFEERTALISIGDPDNPPPRLQHKPDHILRIVFSDIDADEINHPRNKREIVFDETQARRIAEFIFDHKDKINILICQCEYGQSRSAGCAAAISEYFYGNGLDIFTNIKYYPNRIVYHKLIAALREMSLQPSPDKLERGIASQTLEKYKFELSSTECEKLEKWFSENFKENLKSSDALCSFGSDITLHFTPTSIGEIVEAECCSKKITLRK